MIRKKNHDAVEPRKQTNEQTNRKHNPETIIGPTKQTHEQKMTEINVDFDSLTLLLKASSKDQIRELLVSAFDRRFDAGWPSKDAVDAAVETLALEAAVEGDNLLRAIKAFVKV